MVKNNSNPLVSILILNYNAGDLLLNCVDSVFKSTYPNFEVIIIDNLSTDNSHIRCKEKFEKIQLIENKKNLGYCEGNNVGIKSANGEFILILNPDTIVDPDWLNELFRAYHKHGEALYQPKHLSLKEKSVIMSTGNMMNVFGFGYAREKGEKDVNQHNTIEQIGYASGTCLFVPSSIFKNVGLLDPFIFLYHDDLDFGWRAAQLGIKSYYVPSSVIYHAESYLLRWNAEKFFWLERNRKYCLLTHYSKETYAKMRSSLFLVDLCVWMFYLSKGFLAAKIKAELDIYRNRDAIKIRYNQLEKIKTVSDKELIKKFPDEIFVPKNVSEPIFNQLFNNILSALSKKVKKKII
jgi:GT2 family glycosyltransferase